MDYRIIYENWIKNPLILPEALNELQEKANDEKELEYRFATSLKFGTAGMRGLLGYGTNMMNIYTVRRATEGLSRYILSLGESAKMRGVVISYDTRKNSELFARNAAGVLSANGINVYLFNDVRPVPMLSFAVRHLKAIAGIMITASHNPKEYNGYKVYGEDGAQMSPEATAKVVEKIEEIQDYLSVKADDIVIKKSGNVNAYVKMIGSKVDKKYYKTISKLSLSKKAVKQCGKNIKLVYTPVHGSGYVPVTKILSKLGIKATLVEEQICKDINFSTVEVPNPENKETLSLGITLANKINAEVVFGTDPDCDRLGVALKDDSGEFIALTGNQVGVLLTDYVLSRLKEENNLSKNGAIINSYVSTGMAKAIAEDFGVTHFETPVGFKFIGEKIYEFETSHEHEFIFGFEESCGYLRGTHCRDKDAVVASMLFAEMVCYYESKKTSVYKRLKELYEKYGYYIDKNVSTAFSGLYAMDEMNAVVDKLKSLKLSDLGGYEVLAVRDYSKGIRITAEGEEEKINMPLTNCVYYEIENGSFVCVRPSGTEPKLKVYYSIKGQDEEIASRALGKIRGAFESILK